MIWDLACLPKWWICQMKYLLSMHFVYIAFLRRLYWDQALLRYILAQAWALFWSWNDYHSHLSPTSGYLQITSRGVVSHYKKYDSVIALCSGPSQVGWVSQEVCEGWFIHVVLKISVENGLISNKGNKPHLLPMFWLQCRNSWWTDTVGTLYGPETTQTLYCCRL